MIQLINGRNDKVKTIAEIAIDFSNVKNLRQLQTDDVSNSYVAAMCQGFEDWGRTDLEKILGDVVPTGSATSFALPSFENYKVIYKDGNVITIIPKGDHYVH